MNVYKSFYQIGLYDPKEYDSWPWEDYELECGKYLSAKKRICSWNKPAEFDTPKEARTFFQSWKNSRKYKMELIELKKWVEIPDPVFPDDHPYTILKRISANEKSRFAVTASLWFSGINTISDYSRPTQIKYRKILLKYGIDIFSEATDKVKKLYKKSHYKNFSDFEFSNRPKLKVVD